MKMGFMANDAGVEVKERHAGVKVKERHARC